MFSLDDLDISFSDFRQIKREYSTNTFNTYGTFTQSDLQPLYKDFSAFSIFGFGWNGNNFWVTINIDKQQYNRITQDAKAWDYENSFRYVFGGKIGPDLGNITPPTELQELSLMVQEDLRQFFDLLK